MIWGSIWVGGCTDMHIFSTFSIRTANGQRYLDKVIRLIHIPQMKEFDAQFIFTHDNAPCYRVNIVS